MRDNRWLNWWGFRLRDPKDYHANPASRLELMVFFTVLAIGLELSWLGILVFVPGYRLEPLLQWPKSHAVIPLVIAVLPPMVGLLGAHMFRGGRIEGLVILSRERGNLRKWDITVLTIGALGFSAALFRLEPRLLVTNLCLLGLVVASSIGLGFFQKRVDFSKRRWQITVPDWLRRKIDEQGQMVWGEEGTQQKGILPPEMGAKPIYRFTVENDQSYEVGIVIPQNLLAHLRSLNTDAKGRLYHANPEAVVYMDRKPISDTSANQRIISLSQQCISIAEELRLTRFQFASAVLNFVQTQIRYQYDHVSTADFSGGPFEEYGRFPIETLNDTVGDCECTALLCASLLTHLGFDAAVLVVSIENEGEFGYHAAVGIESSGLFLLSEESSLSDVRYLSDPKKPEKKYLYGETAVDGRTMGFGEINSDWEKTMKFERFIHLPAVLKRPQ